MDVHQRDPVPAAMLPPGHNDDLPPITSFDERQLRFLRARARGMHETSALSNYDVTAEELTAWRSDPAFSHWDGACATQGVALQLAKAMNTRLLPTAVQAWADILDNPAAHNRDKISAAENVADRGGLIRQRSDQENARDSALDAVVELRRQWLAKQRALIEGKVVEAEVVLETPDTDNETITDPRSP